MTNPIGRRLGRLESEIPGYINFAWLLAMTHPH